MMTAASSKLRSSGISGADIAVILGSGLSSFADGVEVRRTVPYAEIPGFPATAVGGHRGALIDGRLGGKSVLVLSGRVHHYEGHPPSDVTFGVRLLGGLEVPAMVVSNASGGLDPGFGVGDLMLIVDQLSMLPGRANPPGSTFRMAGAYSPRLLRVARDVSTSTGMTLREGVYMGSLGPTYETPAEIRMARLLGASAVGMSTVTEVQVAVSSGIEVLGLALITNKPSRRGGDITTHEEVLEAGRVGGRRLLSLVSGVVERL
jgi:purine-nucleoside phosphorylase